ncbi:MAG: ATP-dependent 6-phosphofructokinase, partial [Nannocystaceae bacterium]|nr:ATP-dependent 6-phosphofructokinase [Nannocystaceae bacterium]
MPLPPPAPADLVVSRIGDATFPSPLGADVPWVTDDRRVLVANDVRTLGTDGEQPAFERAGPRERLAFDPSKVTCGIVTCGGLCPGLNDVIRSIVMTLHHWYGV